MNKKKSSIIFLLLVVIFALLIFAKVFNERNLKDYGISEEEYQNIISQRKHDETIKLNSLKFNGFNLVLDNNNNYYYSIVDNDKNKYNPLISYVLDDYNLAFLKTNEISEETIENDIHLKAIVYNEEKYDEFSIVVTTLPIITIDTNNKEIFDENIRMNLGLFDNRKEATQRDFNLNGDIHIRGGFSKYNYDKKNYKLSICEEDSNNNRKENKVSLLGLRKDDDYILYSTFDDPDKIRTVFSSNLWYESCANNNQFGVTNGYEYKYVELIVNGTYDGLYALGYKVDADVVGLKNNEIMYKKELPYISEFNNDFLNKEIENAYVIEEIGKNVNDEWEPLRDYYRSLLYSNNNDYLYLYDVVDIDNNIDMYLYVNLIQGVDNWKGIERSIYNLYLSSKVKNGNRVMLLTPWDMDRTWGFDTYKERLNSSENVITELSVSHYLYYFDESFAQRIKNRYWELRKNKWSDENILGMLDNYEKDIHYSGAYARDLKRWPDNEHIYGYHEDKTKKLSEFKQYVLDRLSNMDAYIEGL